MPRHQGKLDRDVAVVNVLVAIAAARVTFKLQMSYWSTLGISVGLTS